MQVRRSKVFIIIIIIPSDGLNKKLQVQKITKSVKQLNTFYLSEQTMPTIKVHIFHLGNETQLIPSFVVSFLFFFSFTASTHTPLFLYFSSNLKSNQTINELPRLGKKISTLTTRTLNKRRINIKLKHYIKPSAHDSMISIQLQLYKHMLYKYIHCVHM